MHKELNLNVVHFDWTKRYKFPLVDLEAQIEYLGIKSEGRGTAYSEEEALTKAVCEAIERYIVKLKDFKNSNGSSCHTSREAAKICSCNELLERDAFLCHFYLNVPAFNSGSDQASSDLINHAYVTLNKMGIELKIALMAGANNSTIAICKANGRNNQLKFGDIFGSAYGDDKHSIEHALIEVLRDLFYILDFGVESISLHEFERWIAPGPNTHLKLALDLDYSSTISFPTINTELSRPQMDHIELSTIEIHDEILERLGLFFIQAKSDEIQNIFWGNFNQENINYKRIESYREVGLIGDGIRKYPHPFG